MPETKTTPPLVSLHGGHTRACDGVASAQEMVEAAARAGLLVFGLSDHFCRPREQRFRYQHEDDARAWGTKSWPVFVDEVLACKGSSPGPTVYLGAEVEFLPGYAEWTRAELARWPLDYAIISVHFLVIRGETVPFDASPDHWSRARELCGGAAALYRCYYEHVLEALTWRVGDVLGHLDVIKVFAGIAVEDARVDALIDDVLRVCAKDGVVLDLNARGLIKPCAEIYPSPQILARAARAGVKVVTGDDSHRPEEVGLNLFAAIDEARRAGYSDLTLPPRLGGARFRI